MFCAFGQGDKLVSVMKGVCTSFCCIWSGYPVGFSTWPGLLAVPCQECSLTGLPAWQGHKLCLASGHRLEARLCNLVVLLTALWLAGLLFRDPNQAKLITVAPGLTCILAL